MPDVVRSNGGAASRAGIDHGPAAPEASTSLAKSARIGERKFPTGGLATLTFAGPWRALQPSHAELAAFVKPRELG